MSNKSSAGQVVNPEKSSIECGLVMPISAIDNCSAEHWAQVHRFLVEAIEEGDSPKFSAKLVSEEADVGMILRRIVQNVYKADIVVCDVSGKNANVMFELGMRLAFDKPVVIIKDDKTEYSFDTSVIEHLEYPRDLRYPSMVEFKARLKAKLHATYAATQANGYQGFLKNFGTFKVAHLEERSGTVEEVLLEAMKDLQKDVARLQRANDIQERLMTPIPTIAQIAKSDNPRGAFARAAALNRSPTAAELAKELGALGNTE